MKLTTLILMSLIFFDGLDLPVDPKDTQTPVETKRPPVLPVPTAPIPTTPPPPTIYGHDLISTNGTVFYVIDVSGSMGWDEGQYIGLDDKPAQGNRLDRAKVALTTSIISLPKSFKFDIIAYDCSISQFATDLVIADSINIDKAKSWVSDLQPGGATGTGPAVAAALATSTTLLILLTDGSPNCPWVGTYADLTNHRNMIKENNHHRSIINVFGIGSTGVFKQFCQDVASDNGGNYSDVR